MKLNEASLYVLASTDEAGDVVGFPKGGGSSTPARIKAYDSLENARRGKRQARHTHGEVVIVKVTEVEVIE